MSTKILHITNGDSTTKYLKKLQFEGQFITWREMLCEGKTAVQVGSEQFWKLRFDFLKTSYKISKKQFIELTLKEYRMLCKQKRQNEIVLWFEHDLFCQINMIAVLSWLKRYRKGRKISLVCSGNIAGSDQLFGLSQLSEKQLKKHYQEKIELTEDDIEYADYVWQLYCANNPIKLHNVYKYQPSQTFKYLTGGLLSHLQRFPTIGNGMNALENKIINLVKKEEFSNEKEFVAKLLKLDARYGFGDVQYFKKIDELKHLFGSLSPVKLNETGQKVQQRLLNVYANLRNDYSYLGGAKKYNFLYDNSSQKLLKITSL